MGFAVDIGTILQTASVGTLGVSLFVGRGLPDAPDDAVAVIQYGGAPPVLKMTTTVGATHMERPRFQIVARSLDYAAAETKARNAWNALHGYAGTVNGTIYGYIQALQSPFYMGLDSNNRCRVAFNVEASKL